MGMRGAALGLAVESDFDIFGLEAGPVVPGLLVRVRGESDEALDRRWAAAADARRLFTQPDASGGRVVATLDEAPELGYRMRMPGLGDAEVAHDGGEVRFAPLDGEPLMAQRLLVGQALPLAALLQGTEVLHASGAVLPDGRAVAISAGSHGGKTSLAVQLVLRGGELLTDDALAVRPQPGGDVLAYPGAGPTNLRHAEAERLDPDALASLGPCVGVDADARRTLIARSPRPATLAAVYFPGRDDDAGDVAFERLPDSPQRLLAATINLVVRTPERMVAQLDACAAIARRVPQFRVAVPRSAGAAELAARIEAHAGEHGAG